MTGIPHQIEIETVPEEDVSRRSFLQQGSACVAGGFFLPALLDEALNFRQVQKKGAERLWGCLLYTSPSPRDGLLSRMPSSA